MGEKVALGLDKNEILRVESPSIGIALIVVGIDPSRNGANAIDPRLWTVREKKTKPETEKVAGQISFPGETKKIGEDLSSNIIGALAEFSSNNFVIQNNLFLGESSHVQGKVFIRNNPVDLVIVAYQGPLDQRFNPVDQKDVDPNGWMTIREVGDVLNTDTQKVRKFAREIVSMESGERLIEKFVGEFLHKPLGRIPVASLLPEGFSSMAQFHQDREKMPDVRVFDVSSIKP